MTVVLGEGLRHRIVQHCLSALPDEGCGLLAVLGDRVMDVYPTGNEDASPVSYTIPSRQHYEALLDAESKGWEIGGVFHSHPRGPAGMSTVDLSNVADPGWLYLVVSLREANPVLTMWRDGEELVLVS